MARTVYMQELESVRQNLIPMGETTTALLTEAIRTVSGGDSGSAERASELEAKTDHQLRTIHDQCFSLITLHAPVARDARLITGILDAIVDLELIRRLRIRDCDSQRVDRTPATASDHDPDFGNRFENPRNTDAGDGWMAK